MMLTPGQPRRLQVQSHQTDGFNQGDELFALGLMMACLVLPECQ